MFPYTGDVTELTAALEKLRGRMVEVYKKVLGSQFYGILEEADSKLLTASSFLNLEQLVAIHGNAAGKTNKFFLAMEAKDVPFNEGGAFTLPYLQVAPGFVFSRKASIANGNQYKGWVSEFFAPYVHEYDHFVIFALQDQPMTAAMLILRSKFTQLRSKVRLSDIDQIAYNSSQDIAERRLNANLLVWMVIMDEVYEVMTRVLDAQIFLGLGYNVPEYYFDVPPKAYMPLHMPSIGSTAVVPVGDVLYGTPIDERLTILSEWLQRFNPSNHVQKNFIDSFRTTVVTKVAFEGL